ncbi:hypothetical protein DSM110093_03672 (plasmid) [Sulfitobacter sp. DSM 110093]|uniref:hypothetical protein n=1 Tax=Sulfitobacter sp. DSM 110093 TaxID=2883127 RepID=UPI001FACCAC7|nr:hypothetical protein [Sulfitobacter sp. DSM 110093]UOA33837.1 hypothetical protein DSM110093_03672 [Sulfitobacter sp. DSM 110093]
MSALNLIYKYRMTFGIELPLDRDWSEAGQRRARIEGRPFGVPDISNPSKHSSRRPTKTCSGPLS